jgi:DNA-binding HxlR family transcriptional regulator
LEDDRIINRKIYAEIPPKVEYTITEFGMILSPILLSMAEWGKGYKIKRVVLLNHKQIKKINICK